MKRVSKMKPKSKVKVKAKAKAVVKKVKVAKKSARAGVSPLRLLNDKQMEQLKKLHKGGKHTGKQLAKMFKVSISTLYNYLNR